MKTVVVTLKYVDHFLIDTDSLNFFGKEIFCCGVTFYAWIFTVTSWVYLKKSLNYLHTSI